MIGQVAAKIAFKTVVSAGGALYGAASSISKTGKAFGMAGKSLGGAAQNTSEQTQSSPNNAIIRNTGMAGTAGKQKVAGGGTLPAAKAIAKPQMSTKMPTEALLDTAVKYLASIDKSLKSQLDFERRSYQDEAQTEREAIIENKQTTTFSDIKDRLSGFKSDVKDNINIAGTVLKVAAILGGAAALIASSLDQKELTALKQNVEQFKKTFGWLGELSNMIPAGGIAGFLFGGRGVKGRLKGGVIGIITSLVATQIYNNMTGQDGESVKDGKSSFNGVTAGVLAIGAGFGISNIAKRLPALRQAGKTAGQLGRATGASSIAGIQAATRKGNSWLATRRGRKFLVIMARKLGKSWFAKLGKYIARIVAGLLVAGTGVGAIPGIIAIIANLAFIGWDIFTIASMIWDAWNDSKTEDTDAQAVAAKPEQIATKVAGTAAGSNAQIAQGSNKSILETIRMKESRNNYSAQNPVSTASGAYQFLDGTWQALSKKYGIGTEYSKAKYAPPEIQDAVADKYVSDILKEAGGDISKVPVAWYTGNIRGSSDAASPEQVAAYQADWLRVYNGGNPDVSASTNTPGVGSEGSGGIQAIAGILGSLGSSIIKPGVARSFASPSSNVSDRISNESMKLQNDITFGVKTEKRKDSISSPSLPAGSPRGISLQKSITSIDPNYKNIDVLTKYIAHFRLAA
jgi:hypothetical protein